jgi:hypothetical protein
MNLTRKALCLAWLAGFGIGELTTRDLAHAAEPDKTVASGTAASAGTNVELQLIERRIARLKALPAPPQPPVIAGSELAPVDAFITAGWSNDSANKNVKPGLCDDATFARRVYLDVVGTIPPLLELNKFLLDRSPTKREKLVDQLLARNEAYAAHWAPYWEDALGSQHVTTQGGIPTRGNYRDWIVQSFSKNRPFDVLVAELLDPTMPGRRESITQEIFGQKFSIDFVRNDTHVDTLQTAANVGQVFLGTSMKCASCHDHFDNVEWSQDRFLAFAGLFAPKDLEKIRCEVKSGVQVPAKFPFALPNAPSTAPIDLRERLHLAAQQIVDPANPRFAKTIVNRLWRRYLGLGLFEPADDYRENTRASHPELLEWLAHDFLAHGCDLKHTIRVILTSRTYQLKYDPKLADRFEITRRDAPRYFRSPSLRRLTCEQVFDSIRVATTGELAPGERAFLDSRSTALMRALGRPASRNEISTARPDDVAVVQSLELLNGPELHELIDTNLSFAKPLPKTNVAAAVDQLYRKILSRPASAEEKKVGTQFLQSFDTFNDGLRDVYWALIVSPEFQYLR